MRASVAVGLYLWIGAAVATACSAQHADDYPNLGAPNGLANRAPPDLSGGTSTTGEGGTTVVKEGGGGEGGGGGCTTPTSPPAAACPSWSRDIFPMMQAAGTWGC